MYHAVTFDSICCCKQSACVANHAKQLCEVTRVLAPTRTLHCLRTTNRSCADLAWLATSPNLMQTRVSYVPRVCRQFGGFGALADRSATSSSHSNNVPASKQQFARHLCILWPFGAISSHNTKQKEDFIFPQFIIQTAEFSFLPEKLYSSEAVFKKLFIVDENFIHYHLQTTNGTLKILQWCRKFDEVALTPVGFNFTTNSFLVCGSYSDRIKGRVVTKLGVTLQQGGAVF